MTPSGTYQRARRERFRVAGLCTLCGQTAVCGTATCTDCAGKRRAYGAARRRDHKARGLCMACTRLCWKGGRCRFHYAAATLANRARARATPRSTGASHSPPSRRPWERRLCRLALVAGGHLVSLHPIDDLALSLGTARTCDLARWFGLSQERISNARNGSGGRGDESTMRTMGLDEPPPLLVTIEETPAPDARVDAAERSRAVAKALSSLTPRERGVLRLRFGFSSGAYTLQQLGSKANVSRERIRQIQEKALRKLRCPPHSLALAGFY